MATSLLLLLALSALFGLAASLQPVVITKWPVRPTCRLSTVGRCPVSDMLCPLSVCESRPNSVVVSDRLPQVFMLCTTQERFCGVCAPELVFDADRMHCRRPHRHPYYHQTLASSMIIDCPLYELCSRYNDSMEIVWHAAGNGSFSLCSPTIAFCAFCPAGSYFDLKRQSCAKPPMASYDATVPVVPTPPLISGDDYVISRFPALRSINKRITKIVTKRPICCPKCLTDLKMSLRDYIRVCRL